MSEIVISTLMMDRIKSSVSALTDDAPLVPIEGISSFVISRSDTMNGYSQVLLFQVQIDGEAFYIYLKR
jgi:hypothetical protein